MRINKNLKTITSKEYCLINNYKYSVIQKGYLQNVYIPRYADDLEVKNYIPAKFPEISMSELLNVNLLGNNSIIFDDNNYCIYDIPFRDEENKFHLKYGNTLYSDKHTTSIVFDDSTQEIIDEGIMLIGNASFNYYHLNMEIFSKLCLIDKLEEYINIPILVDEYILRIPQFKQELYALNKFGRKIIVLKRGHYYKINKLIYLSDLAVIPLNIKEGHMCEYKDLILSDIGIKLLSSSLAIKNDIYRKIFISRKNNTNKRLVNYINVEKIFRKFGYEVIYPETMTFKEQLEIFSQAEYIAGVSGAGLTNILFLNENAKVICIIPKEIELTCYSNIAGILGQEYYFLDAKLSGDKNKYGYYQNSFTADEADIYNFLNSVHK
jgi:capsular polysaccharide biosynthesis protein